MVMAMPVVAEAALPVAVAVLPIFMVEEPISILKVVRICCHLKQAAEKKRKPSEDLRGKDKYLYHNEYLNSRKWQERKGL
jgi:hypothetical protein